MADFKAVSVQDVHAENLETAWPALVQAITNSEFIAVDLELSGIGNRKMLNAHSIDDRYKNLVSVVRSRAVIAVGLSCFRRLDPSSEDVNQRWLSQTFDISTLCSDNYTVEPGSVKFLIDHGFDFNKQYGKGLPYSRGNDQKKEAPVSIRSLIGTILSCGRPLIMHNALLDLAFLYGSFYADLPQCFDKFVADLSTIFAEGGVYDTKCLAEYHVRLRASYLPYIFRYSQRQNYKDSVAGRPHMSLLFLSPVLSTGIDYIKCKLRSVLLATSSDDPSDGSVVKKADVCTQYAAHGYCGMNAKCTKSHDLDDVLDLEDAELAKRSRKRKQREERRRAAAAAAASAAGGKSTLSAPAATDGVDDLSEGEVSSSDDDDDDDAAAPPAKKSCKSQEQQHQQSSEANQKSSSATPSTATAAAPTTSKPVRKWCTGSHRAGFDAFMTGFFFAWSWQQSLARAKGDNVTTDISPELLEHKNKVTLGGKPQPLQLVKSHFARTSVSHEEKWARLSKKT